MLNDTILTIALTVAPAIALVDVMPTFKIESSETSKIMLARRVWKYFLAVFIFGRISQTPTGEVFATNVSTIIFAAFASRHEVFCGFGDTGTQETLFDEFK